ncbi:fatty-acyl-CoA synthase [Lipingzhangella halophila]|uniref:Fatty-acyl-CoA synthase n=1 Tax=Lipingzhangella halophila TaxID=1783352 RepID=A0A7W7W1Z8_9ACTN|nr:acyl-CoA synthetase [Lipingzhangella halophila]MBB4930180.1 fatty-acyl-CoA synthase [Lipingzhangella halophila]
MTAKPGPAAHFTTAAPHGSPESGFALADLFAAVAEAVPDRIALLAGERRLSYRELDTRATLVARHLRSAGIERREHVAILAYNRAEWLESALGVLRAGAVPVNVNYRYVARELRHVLADAGAVALIAERSLTSRVAEIRAELPKLRHVLLLDDGSPGTSLPGTDFENALARTTGDRSELPPASGDDLYLLYTGGTTGDPKGVMWRQADIFRVALESRRPDVPPASSPAELAERARARSPRRMLVLGPLMHAAGQWNALYMLLSGRTVVLNTRRPFDPADVVGVADREGVHALQVVGDTMARPIARQLLADPSRCANLTTVLSGGTPLTSVVRELWREWRPDIALNDSYGGTETGVCGASGAVDGTDAPSFTMGASVAVLDSELRPLPAGSEEVGRIARTGRIPLGYYNDPERTARTFPRDSEGRRWAISGDYGTIAADGSVRLLGRGSAVINTGGEKVYPEEVESVLKAHPDIDDTIVVPAPDDHLGQQVCAVIAAVPGRRPSEEQLRAHCRTRLAGFKVPRAFHLVDQVRRTAVGKQDYRWAMAVARRSA